MATTCIVVPNAEAEACNEALGRLYADSLDEDYPVPGRFPDGSINPNPLFATYYYTVPRPGANGTETAFNVDATVQGWLGQLVNTSLGDYTIPSITSQLEESWFAVEE